jgi:pimeloyl-ACP methyl ester carboxylesterase
VTGTDVAASLGGLISPADHAVLTSGLADYFAAGLRAAVSARASPAGGTMTWPSSTDWGFSLGWGTPAAGTPAANIPAAPVAVWQGDQDLMVPFAHGQWLAANIPGARAHLLPGRRPPDHRRVRHRRYPR